MLELTPEEKNNLPRHVALIMDGNGRWARSRKMPRLFGHRNGVENVRAVVDAAKENGIYIPTLCHFREINPSLGTCRICTVNVNGKFTTSCTTKVQEGMTVEINTPELIDTRTVA